MPWFFKDPIVTVTWLNLDHAQLNSKKWPNMIKLPQMNFFLEKQLIKYSCTYVSFCKIFKKILEPIQSYEDVPFLGPKWPISPEQNFFGTNHYYYFHLPIGPFHCAKFSKNSSSKSRVMRMCHFWAQNGPFAQIRIFSENLFIGLVPFIHAYLHAKNQSQILIY